MTHGRYPCARDFVLRYKVAGDASKSAFLAHSDRIGQYFTMALHPRGVRYDTTVPDR